MTKTKMYSVVLGILIAAGVTFAWTLTARAAYESAEYAVIQADGPFEVREYPDLVLASTGMRAASQGSDGSFMRLFQYISGKNELEQKIAMTTPVFMAEPPSDAANGRMGFVLPKEVASRGAPQPASSDVQLQTRRGGRFAVMRFSGRMHKQALEDAEQKLRQWMEANGLSGASEIESAGYDPPWTPGPWRRNEVLIRLDSDLASAQPETAAPSD